ncbi:MAG: hypothetical protein ACLF0G_14170 [Candidatus Brocadiia bacterium]
MSRRRAVPGRWVALAVAVLAASAGARPSASVRGGRLVVTAPRYRLTMRLGVCSLRLELRDGARRWRPVSAERSLVRFALADEAGVHTTGRDPARVRYAASGDAVLAGMAMPLGMEAAAQVHLVCVDEGVLVGFKLLGTGDADARVWALPRFRLSEPLFDSYAFWSEDDALHSGRVASLGERDAFAGVSPWGQRGDTAGKLSDAHPAVVAWGEETGVALAAVFLGYADAWGTPFSFVQRYGPSHLYFYPAQASAERARRGLWAWLAPLDPGEPAAWTGQVERLVARGAELRRSARPLAPEPDEDWTRPVPDFPDELRRERPVDDIRQAVAYTINESIHSRYGVELARKVGSDVLVRAWFRWRDARDYAASSHLVGEAHRLGALFGGGTTCSALYEGENGISRAQLLDMATRGPDGELVDAWGQPGVRHGSLSSPAYRQYLLHWCKLQVDAGADYLFMDEIDAALGPREGFDDYSVRDFRQFLRRRYCEERGWAPDDPRWRERFGIALEDEKMCPDGTMASFRYRAYLAEHGHVERPHDPSNPLAGEWHLFRRARDERAWAWLAGAIRDYARSQGRRVLLSANGLAPHVDLQVLGVWQRWRAREGRVDFSESQLEQWASVVTSGRELAGARVPVVFFHDWGFGGFPWLEVPPGDRELWMRVLGAEIYAAGGFFAFPVRGPFGQDARRDGTLREIARQTAFYQRHRSLYLDARLLGFRPLEASEEGLSLALWAREEPPALLLHAVNRRVEEGRLRRRRQGLSVRLPTAALPQAVRVCSPDWAGERRGSARADGDCLLVALPELEAYAVAVLDYAAVPEVRMAPRRIVPAMRWARPARREFPVQADGTVGGQWALNGFLQGKLHAHLRNPPTFLVHLPRGGALLVHVRAVAAQGSVLECLVDGALVRRVELGDRDGRNEPSAPEHERTLECPLPPGRHRVTVRNVGGDWATVAWYAFRGQVEPWGEDAQPRP